LGSAAFPLIFAYARESTSNRPGHDATFAISLLRSFFSLAWVIGPLFGIWILQAYQFNGLFRFTVLIFVLVFILVIFRLQRRMTAMPGQATKTTSTPLLQHLRRYEVWTTCISFIAVSTSLSINGLFMPLFVTKTLHASAHVVGGMFSLCAGLEIPFMLLLGKLASRLGKRQLLLTGSIFGTFYYTCASFAHAPWQMLSLQAVYAVFISISVSIGMSYMQDFIPDSPGSATTLFSNTNNIGAMAGSLVGGIIAESFGYRYVYVFCAVLGVISYLFLLRRRTQSQPYVSAPSLHTQEENF
jgi:MFS transporter, SET family, sugar efflux transporter